MDRVQRTDRIPGERLAGAVDDLGSDVEHVPVRGDGGEMRPPVGGFSLRQLAQGGRPMEDAIALDERQVRRQHDCRVRQRLAHEDARLFVEQPREHGARLGVEAHRSPRSASSSAAAVRLRGRDRGSAG